jgi:hypothetical protein
MFETSRSHRNIGLSSAAMLIGVAGGHQRHRAHITRVAASLAALRDDDVDAALGRLDLLRNGRDLQHHARSHVLGLPHQVARVSERKGMTET